MVGLGREMKGRIGTMCIMIGLGLGTFRDERVGGGTGPCEKWLGWVER